MRELCEDIKQHVSEVLAGWESLVREQPWIDLPPEHRIDNLPDVVVGLVQSSLCDPADPESHLWKVRSAAEHGTDRRKQGFPEHLLFSEYHLLREAIWRYVTRKHGSTRATSNAIMQVDAAITLATSASLVGYHRQEVEALGGWDERLERLARSSPLLASGGG